MPSNKRFEKVANRLGYSIHPVFCRVNDKWSRREDILTVEKHGEWLMTIPKQMYVLDNPGHRDLLGLQHPSYFDCEAVLYQRHYGR